MKSKQQKKEELAGLKNRLLKAKITIITSFAREGERGLSVGEMGTLKKDLRTINSEYLVEKKTLFDKALTQSPITNNQSPINVFEYPGSLGAVFGYGDEQSAAKSVYNFARKYPALKYFGAIWNGKFMNLTQFTEFAKLPSKEVMIAGLLGMMKYPLSALAIVLKQIADKNQNLEARK